MTVDQGTSPTKTRLPNHTFGLKAPDVLLPPNGLLLTVVVAAGLALLSVDDVEAFVELVVIGVVVEVV